ncbi:hypothetical protein Tco_0790074 [Tanacetum coccineum]
MFYCKPKPYCDEQKKVAIGYKNPLCLTRAKQVQPALYNVHEIIKTNHVPAIVHNSEDTLEIAKITRKKMNDKMKTPLWTEQNINIRPPDYSKENYLATFTPQTQLTPSQIFWSKDVLKMKAEALKEQTPASRPIKALTVYPPNTPATLVPRELLEYVIGTCPKDFNKRDEKHASTLLTRKKQVTFEDQCETSNIKTHKHVEQLTSADNVPCDSIYRVKVGIDASGSQPRSNTKKNRISPAKSVNKKKVEEHPRTNKSSLKTTNRVDSSISSKRTLSKFGKLALKQVWKATGTKHTRVGYQWRPRKNNHLGEQCPITSSLNPILVSLPTSPENQAIAASMQSAIAYANQQEPNQN